MNDDLPKLPKNWIWTTLDSVCSKITDGTHFSPPNMEKGEIPYITAKNVRPDGIDVSNNITYVTKQIHKEIYARCNPEKGDVLYTKDGTVGFAAVNEFDFEFSMLSSVSLLKPNNLVVDSYYLKHYLNSPETFERMVGKMTGTALRRIVLNRIKKAEFALAPINEQRRIVSKIEDLIKESKTTREALDKVLQILKKFKQSVLDYAIRGELVPQNSDDEPVEKILEKISKDKKKKWEDDLRKKGKDPKKFEYEEPESVDIGELQELPNGWLWINVGNLGDVITGKTPSTGRKDFFGNDYPFIKPTDLNIGYHVTKSNSGLSKKGIKQVRLLPPKSILVTCIGATIGKTGFLRVEGATNQQINALIPDQRLIIPEFAYFLFISKKTHGKILERASATTLPILKKSSFEKITVQLPPINEQKRIVSKIEKLFSFADQIEKSVEEAKKRADRIDQAILAKAFRGELVPQDPNDEPASVLLDRIMAQKEKRLEVKQTVKRKSRKSK